MQDSDCDARARGAFSPHTIASLLLQLVLIELIVHERVDLTCYRWIHHP